MEVEKRSMQNDGKKNPNTSASHCAANRSCFSLIASIDYGFIVSDLHHLFIFTSSAGFV